jgi:HK97 family phage portal protein
MPADGGHEGTPRDAHGRFARLDTRSLRPDDSTAPASDADLPNGNPPGDPPTVGPDDYTPPTATPPAIVLGASFDTPAPPWPPSRIHPSAWDGWPSEWNVPLWGGRVEELTDVAWMGLDLNASVFASMPPYLVGASPTLPDEWMANPDPDQYTSWSTFAHSLMWDFQLGEAFVICTARYSGPNGPGTGWPARFHVAPPWSVNVDFGRGGLRDYSIGGLPLDPDDVLHLRYRTTVDNARGTGPLDASGARLVAARVLLRYLTQFVQGGAVPSSVLEAEDDLTAKQAGDLHDQWLIARMSKLGLPAILSGGVTWKPTQTDPLSSALAELAAYTEAKLSVALGVPPFLLGLPSGGDSMTYSNVSSIFDYHWRGGLRPKAQRVMMALSQWLVPRGTTVEVNRDEYVRPGPLERAQTWEIYLRTGVVTVEEVREAERFGLASTTGDSTLSGVLK